MISRAIPILLFSAASSALQAEEGDPSIQHLFPIPEDAQKVLEERCIFCHGEVIDGEPEIREDLDLSSEKAIRETLLDLDTMLEMIEDDEMPYEAKLSFRLRRRPEMQKRLSEIKDQYEANDEKEILLAWLRQKPE